MRSLIILLAVLLLGIGARAETYYWCGESFAAFGEASNWTNSTGRVENPPGAADDFYGLESRALDLGGTNWTVHGWNSTGNWNRYTMELTNGTLTVGDYVKTHSDTINILSGAELVIGPSASYCMAEGDAGAHRINVQSNGVFSIDSPDVWIYKAEISIAAGGRLNLRASPLSIYPNTWQTSTIVNRGTVSVGTSFLLGGGSSGATFIFRQVSGVLELGGSFGDGDIAGSNRFVWEGGTIKVLSSMRLGFAAAEVASGAQVEMQLADSVTFDFGAMSFGEGSSVRVIGGKLRPPANCPSELVLDACNLEIASPGVYDLSGIAFRNGAKLVVAKGLKTVRDGNTLTVTSRPVGSVGVVGDFSATNDSRRVILNPACGYAGGWWTTLANDGTVTTEDLSGNCSKLWCLAKFSKGYVYDGQYENFTNHVQNFVGGADIPLNEGALMSISNTLLSVRRNGGTVVTRIAYTWDGYGGCECDDFDMVLTHIRQVAGVYNCFTDVIAAVECGVIGAYGEMHTSRYTDSTHANQIIEAWLANMDASIPLLVRTPAYLLNYIGESASNVIYNAASLSAEKRAKLDRIGFYNDGYLGTWWDYGTWGAMTREQGCEYLRTRPWLSYGGEFAGVSHEFFNGDYNAWKLFDTTYYNIVKEWYDTHLSYLRTIESDGMTIYQEMSNRTFRVTDYAFSGMPGLNEYDGVDLRTFCRDHMGARFVVRAAKLVREGELTLTIENTGFASVRFPLSAEVLFVMRDATGPSEALIVPAATSATYPVPGETKSMTFTFTRPDGLYFSGAWELGIRLFAPLDDESACPESPRRPFRFANAPWDFSDDALRLFSLDLRERISGTLVILE